MLNNKLLDIVGQNVYIKHLVRKMAEEIYSGLFDKKSLKKYRKEIITELDKLINMVNK